MRFYIYIFIGSVFYSFIILIILIHDFKLIGVFYFFCFLIFLNLLFLIVLLFVFNLFLFFFSIKT